MVETIEHRMVRHAQHHGELAVQQKRGVPATVASFLQQIMRDDMPMQHQEFFSNLDYVSLGTIDQLGRPWSTILTKNPGSNSFINVSSDNELNIWATVSTDDPFYQCLVQSTKTTSNTTSRAFAGVGVDFKNRRRNKLAGVILSWSYDPSTSELSLHLMTNENLGNCPKYITVRNLVPAERSAAPIVTEMNAFKCTLTEDMRDLLNQASTVFLSTVHTTTRLTGDYRYSDMGLNHRGGAAGFVRTYEESGNTYLVLPDYSGNRFYQSLGNVESDQRAGLIVPSFHSGDSLFITGFAENLYDADAAAIMPRTTLITRIRVTGLVFIKQYLQLGMTTEEQFSPYNPPLRYLTVELQNMCCSTTTLAATTATLVGVRNLSSLVSTFTFKLSRPIEQTPGGYAIFDFSEVLQRQYQHMNQANPQLVNDDGVRTWTVSSAPKYDHIINAFERTSVIDITVKRKDGGYISPLLHQLVVANHKQLQLNLIGVGGEFTSLSKKMLLQPALLPPAMLWLAGGVGITPFMSLLSGIVQVYAARPELAPVAVDLFYSAREDECKLLVSMLESSFPSSVQFRVKLFLTGAATPQHQYDLQQMTQGSKLPVTATQRRIRAEDFDDLTAAAIASTHVFACGPDALLQLAKAALEIRLSGVARLHWTRESFLF